MDNIYLLVAIVGAIGFLVSGVTSIIQAIGALSSGSVKSHHRKWLYRAIIAFFFVSVVFGGVTYLTSRSSSNTTTSTSVSGFPSTTSSPTATSTPQPSLSAPTSTPSPIPTATPTPQWPATYHLSGTWNGKDDKGISFTRTVYFSFTINAQGGLVGGSATLGGNQEMLYDGQADDNMDLDFWTQPLGYGAYGFEWKGTLTKDKTVTNGTVRGNYAYDGTWSANTVS